MTQEGGETQPQKTHKETLQPVIRDQVVIHHIEEHPRGNTITSKTISLWDVPGIGEIYQITHIRDHRGSEEFVGDRIETLAEKVKGEKERWENLPDHQRAEILEKAMKHPYYTGDFPTLLEQFRLANEFRQRKKEIEESRNREK